MGALCSGGPMARRDEGSRHGGTQRSVTEEKRGKWPARAQPEGLLIFGAAAALLVGQRSVKDILPPRALAAAPNLQQRITAYL